ncbi:MAG TPA: RagB/SusD family nutrient uptake outer membrane protein [Paludibacteraceae bacterium]|nr:RagB/SusD family nutrient uptake outer membrane protein [Paludibacteraceae bacterium]HOK99930.1 RagB/SusD family nutrient uptake outer membrane protein [Paludibacteraceae bacterium]HPO66735.1 RagB/SusD family nutrient uptake outer membrane protein [Paludibacteraceae bacterium]HRU63759.1 RagB/SusD family nutrient uptake outer membrane protein [Paludibacteraceae bacterium]
MKSKQNIWMIPIVGIVLLFFVACTDSYESFPVEQFTKDYVFSKTDSMGVQARNFLNSLYGMLDNGHNGVGGDYLDAASDDAISIKQNEPDVYKLAVGQYSANNRISSTMGWGKYYEAIRKANIIIKNIDAVPFKLTFVNINGEVKPLNYTIKAEARFLRAYFYFELVKRYGGVPLLGDSIYNLEDNMEIPRNSFADCIDYMVRELDTIKYDLRSVTMPDPSVYAHAATIEAAMALKSRILLYAASPLFNEKPITTDNNAQKLLIGYESYDIERWKKAADAAKYFIDTFGPTGKKTVDLAKNQMGVFLSFYSTTANPELIFFRQGGMDKSVETNNGPLGFSGNSLGNGRTNPTQNLVDAFLMKDGKPRGESTLYPYDPQKPYDNRDPRLGLTILYNGANWLGRVLETYRGGANNPTGTGEYTKTSYYMRKFMGNFANATEYSNNYHHWVILRYTEILLNYAEALNEYLPAPSQDVYNAIISLRKRAGIPAGSDKLYGLKANMTKEEMRKVIQNERRIEMAFEEQRYWDIRRWRIAEDIFKTPLKGMNIIKTLSGLNYSEVDVLTANFEEKQYLYPIPYSEVIKNRNMVQNPKW